MEKLVLNAELREEKGKKLLKLLRSNGYVPAVVYNKDMNEAIKIKSKDFDIMLRTKGAINALIDLEIKDNEKLNKRVMIKEMQVHPVKNFVLHVDFVAISLTEKLITKVAIEVTGSSIGVNSGGILEHHLWEIDVKCLPTSIPSSLKLDISSLDIGDSLCVKDVDLPDGVEFEQDPEFMLLSVIAPKGEEEVSEEGEEGVATGEITEPEVIGEKKEEEEQKE